MTILCYHEVHPTWASEVAVTPDAFLDHMRWLARSRLVVDLHDGVERFDRRMRLPRGLAALTFDDGFAGVYEHALPVLRELRLPATVFLVAATLMPGGKEVDWVRDAGDHRPLTLTIEQVREMRESGIRFGSHALTHRLLPTLSDEACLEELTLSREVLQDLLGEHVDLLAYPGGHHDARVRRLVERAGYRNAFALPERREPPEPYAVPRVGVYWGNDVRTVRVKASRWFLLVRAAVRAIRAGRVPERAPA